MEGGSTLGQQLVGMSSCVERKILGSDGTVGWYWLLELVVEVGHAHGQMLGMQCTVGLLLILTTGTDGRTGAVRRSGRL